MECGAPKFVRTCSPKQSKHCQIWPRFPNPRSIKRSKTPLIQYFFCNKLEVDINTHTRLTALFPGLPGWAGTRKEKKQSGFY